MNPKTGLTDLIGTTIVTRDKSELDKVRDDINSGRLGKVIEFEDMYANPKGGYRAYHFLVERDGMPVEVQVKTKRQKALNELSHEPYKQGKLNAPLLLKMTQVAADADMGDKKAAAEYDKFMQQPDMENVFFDTSMAHGGRVKLQMEKGLYKGFGLIDAETGEKVDGQTFESKDEARIYAHKHHMEIVDDPIRVEFISLDFFGPDNKREEKFRSWRELDRFAASSDEMKSGEYDITIKVYWENDQQDNIYVDVDSLDGKASVKAAKDGDYSAFLTKFMKNRMGGDYPYDMPKHNMASGGMMAKGGKTSYLELARKIAAGYEGKAVKPEYQSKYGKRYDKDEAMQVGKATAAKIERQKGRM